MKKIIFCLFFDCCASFNAFNPIKECDAQVRDLSPERFKSLEKFKKLTNKEVQRISLKQIPSLTIEQINTRFDESSEKFSGAPWTEEQIASFTPEQIKQLDPEIMKTYLSGKQIAALTCNQIKSLTGEQVSALAVQFYGDPTLMKEEQFKAFTLEQTPYLNLVVFDRYLHLLTTEQIRCLKVEQIEHLSKFDESLKALTEEQIRAFTLDQIMSLNLVWLSLETLFYFSEKQLEKLAKKLSSFLFLKFPVEYSIAFELISKKVALAYFSGLPGSNFVESNQIQKVQDFFDRLPQRIKSSFFSAEMVEQLRGDEKVKSIIEWNNKKNVVSFFSKIINLFSKMSSREQK